MVSEQNGENVERKIKVGVFNREFLVETVTLRFLPRVGDYIHLRHQKALAWQIEAVVFMQDNSLSEWDIVVCVGRHPLDAPSKELYQQARDDIWASRGVHVRGIREDRARWRDPSTAWQRRKALYERAKAGESVESIAESEGIKVHRAKALIGDWKRLLWRLRGRAHEEVDGKTFDIAELDGSQIEGAAQ